MEKKDVLLFDLLCSQPVGETKFHGGGEYVKTVFRYLIENRQFKESIIVYYNKNEFIDDWIKQIISVNQISVEHVELSKEIHDKAIELSAYYNVTVFCGLPYSYRNYSFPSNVRFVGVVHGLRDIEKYYDSSMFYYSKGIETVKNIAKYLLKSVMKKRFICETNKMIDNCDILIVDSNHTKYAIKVFIPERSSREILVFYPATQLRQIEEPVMDNKEHYIMLISANRWLKNSYRTIKALDTLYSRGQLNGIKTYVYGNIPSKIRRRVLNDDRFEYHGYVSTEELEKAYQNCDIFLYLTLNEGFGNVPMEAMKYGKTCIVSAVCSLPEVYQDAVYYCNPYDVNEIQNRVLQAIDNKVNKEKILGRLDILHKRQIEDLNRLCDILLNIRTE